MFENSSHCSVCWFLWCHQSQGARLQAATVKSLPELAAGRNVGQRSPEQVGPGDPSTLLLLPH